ncbi:4'-phosphopantetheinyl transferase superfamily protein [Telmatospirillum sp.]|uniref:4'-phosphopantetheinyl transferase family protein n=1 Tax=Telmatospirillum sp. TaxID=2079197 RepID=UPI00285216EC|nr:4'-phosphopantetheinyl transferase superfamily protein [Telmatospirillum sp.]MDR3439076.1 4'-phosphopantetheinyl transferase superfamily protein [Telmatospirillum sp.]
MDVALAFLPVEDLAVTRLVDRWATAEDRELAMSRAEGLSRSSALAARAVLRALLAEISGVADWRLSADARGKPLAQSAADGQAASVSLSHGGGLVAVAASLEGGDLGIDVEPHRFRNISALAEFSFGPDEQAAVAAGGIAAFYRIWSLREAQAKAVGDGLAMVADGRDRVAGGPFEGCWIEGSWGLAHIVPEPGFSLALAVRRRTREEDLRLCWPKL